MIDHQELSDRIYALPVEDQSKVVDFVVALEKQLQEERVKKKAEAFERLEEDCKKIQEEIRKNYPDGVPDGLYDYKNVVAEEIERKYGCLD